MNKRPYTEFGQPEKSYLTSEHYRRSQSCVFCNRPAIYLKNTDDQNCGSTSCMNKRTRRAAYEIALLKGLAVFFAIMAVIVASM